jgi:hypothetical protein
MLPKPGRRAIERRAHDALFAHPKLRIHHNKPTAIRKIPRLRAPLRWRQLLIEEMIEGN